MKHLTSLEEANAISAIRLIDKRQRAKDGDVFRLSPAKGIYLWGRLIKRAKFFGIDGEMNLVYIYDTITPERPDSAQMTPENLILPPIVVNNLGWSRGYWEIVASEPIDRDDMLAQHRFVRYAATGSTNDYAIVDESGKPVKNLPFRKKDDPKKLSQSGISNFNHIDWLIRQTLQQRGVIDS